MLLEKMDVSWAASHSGRQMLDWPGKRSVGEKVFGKWGNDVYGKNILQHSVGGTTSVPPEWT
jgi:hypothetical protein